ncbi:enoyl-CoA hydratase/isomerase family protein [Paraburkholderia sp. 32]|uniref:enoyl-CoA hydratase/isomerase family protein n=1 Tax=Paraburkholderia sp. 32 TaxID=2991057 RepID=UPI003D23337D
MTVERRLKITKVTPNYWSVLINNPPINLYDPEMFAEINVLLDELERDKDVQVIVLESANPDFWVAHYDFNRADVMPDMPGAAPYTEWPHMVARFAQQRVLSVAKLRGRLRGQGSELALACDIRFASKEKTILGQPEVGVGVVPGGGGTEWLATLVGRSRALEIVCGGDDFDADTAERYGWINRSIPDAELDAFVDRFARRVGGFLKRPLELAKKIVNAQAVYPNEAQLWSGTHAFLGTTVWPESQARLKRLIELGFMQPGDMEMNMGERIAREADFSDLPRS